MRAPCQEAEMTPIFSFKINVFVLIFAVISTVTYAFASSITGNSSHAGEGTGVISGYIVSNVSYEQGNDPSKIASTSLTLDAPATKVQIKLSDTQVDWYNCTNVDGNNWICDTQNSSISSANQLQVIAMRN
jgi:hypothetical protein